LCVGPGEINIAAVLGEDGQFRVAGAELDGTQTSDHCPHHRAIREIEAQDRQAGVISRDLEIGIEKALPEVGATAILQVHHREGDFAHHVDPAHRIVEFDAIEDGDLAIDARDVAKVQVAVAFADEPASLPLGERNVTGSVLTLDPKCERIELRPVGGRPQERADLGKILQRYAQNVVGPAEGAVRRGDINRGVKGCDLGGQHVDIQRLAARCAASSGERLLRNSCILTAYSGAGPSPPRIGASIVPVIATTSR
jgi:hypothetical protein